MAAYGRHRTAKENRAQCPHRAGAARGAWASRVSAQRMGSPSVLAAEETKRQSVPGYVTLARGNQKAHQYGGALSWDLLQVGPCLWFHVAWLVILLFLQSFADGLYSINVILERMRYLSGMWGEQGPGG